VLGWAALAVAACSHGAPEPEATVPPAVSPAAPRVAPHAATGVYDLTTTLQRNRPAPARQPPRRSRRQAPAAADTLGSLRLQYQQLAAPDPGAPSLTQLAAVISIPGYTQAPRGRPGQAAVWWPLPGDSVVVHFQPPRAKGVMDLRGALRADTLAGDIWYTSTETGSSYQMGTFRAVKKRTS
jgi:hypothetical protein